MMINAGSDDNLMIELTCDFHYHWPSAVDQQSEKTNSRVQIKCWGQPKKYDPMLLLPPAAPVPLQWVEIILMICKCLCLQLCPPSIKLGDTAPSTSDNL